MFRRIPIVILKHSTLPARLSTATRKDLIRSIVPSRTETWCLLMWTRPIIIWRRWSKAVFNPYTRSQRISPTTFLSFIPCQNRNSSTPRSAEVSGNPKKRILQLLLRISSFCCRVVYHVAVELGRASCYVEGEDNLCPVQKCYEGSKVCTKPVFISTELLAAAGNPSHTTFRAFRVLPCLHSFCYDCIKQESAKGTSFPCPVCHMQVLKGVFVCLGETNGTSKDHI